MRFRVFGGASMVGQSLQQQAGSTLLVGSQPDMRIELLRLFHIVLQHFGDRITFHGHHALIGLLAFLAICRIQNDDKPAIAVAVEQRLEGGVVGHHKFLTQLHGGANAQIRLAFDYDQGQRPVALQLQYERTVEFNV